MAACAPSEVPSLRAARLREVASRALTETIASGCSAEEFANGFAGLSVEHRALLLNMHEQAQTSLRESTLAEFELLFSEMGAIKSLETLDALLARQPELPDGSRVPLTSLTEAKDMIAAATLPSKRQHKIALQQAIRQVEEENAALQEQYLTAQPALQAASQEIAACKALVEKTASTCERWRATNA